MNTSLEELIRNMEYVCSYFSSNDTKTQTPHYDAMLHKFGENNIVLYIGLLITTSRSRRLEHPRPNSKEALYFRLPYFEVQKRLGISLKIQTRIRKIVKDSGLVEERIFGNDGYKNYKLDWNKVAEIVRAYENMSNPTITDRRRFVDVFSVDKDGNNEVQYRNPLKSPAYAEREDGKESGRSKLDARNPLKSPAYAEREDYKREEKIEEKMVDKKESSNTSYSRTLSHYHSGPPEAGDQVAVLEVRKKRTPLPLPSKSIEVKERPLPKGASHGFIQPKGVVRQTLNGANDVRQHVSPEVYGLLVYWNEKHGTVTHKLPELVNNCLINPTNTISKSAKVLGEILSGTFFLKIPSLSKYNKIFKPEDIRRAMDNHRTACTDLTVLPVNKDVISKTALIDFLYNERAVEAGMQYCSPMLYFFLKKPMDSKTYIPDIKMTEREQVCYDALLKHMEKTVKVDNAKHWTDFDLKCFRMAARHANRFSLDYDKVFMGDTIYTPGGAMLWYIKMAIKVNDDDFSPELLASRFTPMKVQKYLEKEGHWSESGFYVGLDYLADRPELCRMVGRMREKTVRRSFLVEYRFQNKIPKDHEERKLFNAQLDEYEAKRDVMIKEYESKDKPNGNMKRRMNRAA